MKSSDILRVERIDKDERTFVIRWQMTHLCNFYCDFCIQGNRERHIMRAQGESAQIREKICTNLIAFIEKELNDRADVLSLHLIGGEVTILNDFMPILRRLMKVKFRGKMKIHITTNMSISKEMCRKLAAIAYGGSQRRISMRCSYYKEFTDEKSFLGKIKALSDKSLYQKFLIKYLHRNSISFVIAYPLFSDQDYGEYQRFRERNPQYAQKMQPLIIRDYKTSVSQEIKDKLKKEEEEKQKQAIKVTWKDGRVKYFSKVVDLCLLTDEEPFFRPKGFLCDAGCQSLTVDPLGNMSRCVEAVAETKYGNLCEESPRYMKEMFRCPAERCTCNYYSRIENDLQGVKE